LRTNMPIIPAPYQQYQGVWTLSQASDAVAQSKWPGPGNSLFSWGTNTAAIPTLGFGTSTTSYSSPKQVGSLKTWLNVVGSQYNMIATKSDGTLWAWGNGSQGANGLGNTTYYSSPKQVGSSTDWANIQGMGCRSFWMIAKSNGTLWGWGNNDQGQLGLSNATAYSTPKQIGALTNWSNVSCGFLFSAAVKTDGTLWAWGQNQYGQLGLNNTTNYSSPKQIGALSTWSNVSCVMYYATLAVKTDGTLWSWGWNNNGQLGLNNATYYSSPRQVGALTNWSKVYAGILQVIALKTDGTLWAWGDNSYGKLGLGNTTGYSSPKQIGALTNWSNKIWNRNNNTLAIKTDGTLWTWGYNNHGQLGLGNTTNYSSPKQIGALTSWLAIAGAQDYTVTGISRIIS